MTLSTVALLLWSPATSFARDSTRAGGKQTEQGESLKTALVSAGLLGRWAGYDKEHGSAAVRGLQVRLRRLGLRPGPIDGLFGPLTEGAVERFQVARGLPSDGLVGPDTRKSLLAQPVVRASRPAGPRRDRAPAVDAPPPRDVAPDAGSAPRVEVAPRPSDGLAPEVAAGLGALVAALLLGGAWLVAGRRRGASASGHRAGRDRTSAIGLRLGMVCAALLAVFAVGAVAGALFATQAAPGDRGTVEARGTAAIPAVPGAAAARAAVQNRPRRSPSSP